MCAQLHMLSCGMLFLNKAQKGANNINKKGQKGPTWFKLRQKGPYWTVKDQCRPKWTKGSQKRTKGANKGPTRAILVEPIKALGQPVQNVSLIHLYIIVYNFSYAKFFPSFKILK